MYYPRFYLQILSYQIGYHVIGACYGCLSADNNGHYWMFHGSGVRAEPKKTEKGEYITWKMLSQFENEPTLLVHPANEAYLCAICYEILNEPMMIKCGHTFCKVCIFREIDVRKRCPLCRTAVSFEHASPNIAVLSTVENIEIYCRYGCKKDSSCAGMWVPDPHGCTQIIRHKERLLHEKDCKFKNK